MGIRAFTIAVGFLVAGIAGVPSARADICGEYRTAIDVFVAQAAEVIVWNDTLDAVRKGVRAARSARAALKTLRSEPALRVLELADAPASDRLEKVESTSTAVIEAFEAINEKVKAVSDDLSSSRAERFDAARIAADAAAELALDSLTALGAVPRRGALKAASASAAASPGKTTSSALASVYESIFRAACE